MIGGVVTKVNQIDCATLELQCEELNSTSRCGVKVEATFESHQVRNGDQIWWQGANVFWTPHGGQRKDIPLKKIGYSYALK